MKNSKYDFLKGTNIKFLLALIFGTVYNLMHLGAAYFMMVLIDAGNASDMAEIKRIVYKAIVFLLAFIILGIIRGITLKSYKQATMHNYKRMYVDSILAMKFTDFKKNANGKYLSNLTNNAQVISEGFVEGRINIIRASTRALAVIVVMLVMNWEMFLITLVCFTLPLFCGTVLNSRIVKLTSQVSDKNAKIVTSIKDLLAGFGVIKSFGAENEVSDSFSKDFNDLECDNAKLRQLDVLSYVFSDFSTLLMMIIVFIVGALFVVKGIMTIGGLMAFVQLLVNLQGPLEVLPGFIAKYNAAKKLINEDYIEIKEDEHGLEHLDTFSKGVDVKDLSFAYDGKNNVIHNVDIELKCGKMYAIVGSSGSGKSTLANLLCGNYPDYAGHIMVDNNEIRNIGNLYDTLTVIDQNVFIFNDSIYNNISMFKDFSEESMDRAIKLSGLSKLIEEKGGDYQCGENGSNLSGGEKQRISIARSMLLKKQFVIMDESTSNLDIVTARDIENTVYGLEDTLRLIITHNLNDTFLKKCDEIFVMKNGSIVEHGKFDDLLDRKQFFSSMYELWN